MDSRASEPSVSERRPAAPSLADELIAARVRLTRRIETLELAAEAPSYGAAAGGRRALIAELSGVVLEIDLRLAELGPEDRMTTSPPVI